MNTNLLISTEQTISNGKVPSDGRLFAGAHLIITDRPLRNRRDRYNTDVIVCSPHAREISWVVFQLKEVFSEDFDKLFGWKYQFYEALGEAANKSIAEGNDKRTILADIVDHAKDLFSNRNISVGPQDFL